MREVYRLSLRRLTGPVRLGLIPLLGALPVSLNGGAGQGHK